MTIDAASFGSQKGSWARTSTSSPSGGLVDEIRIHLINVLLGGGHRLFDQLPERTELEQTGVSQTDGVTHLEYRVVR
jgi:dihydrofolate reductase